MGWIWPAAGLLAGGTLALCTAGAAAPNGDPVAARAAAPDRVPLGPVRPALDGNRGPFKVAFTADGSRALVTEFDEGALAVIDRASGRVVAHVPTGGTEPTGVAATSDGSTAIVTNSLSGSVAFVDLRSHKQTGQTETAPAAGGSAALGNLTAPKAETIPLPGAPWDVVLSPDGRRAYVSVSQLDQIAVFDVASRRVVAHVPTGRRPRSLAITPDGARLAAGCMTAGSITFVSTRDLAVIGQGRTPAVNLRGVALFGDGRDAFAVAQRAQNERPTETATGIWSNQAFLQSPNGPRNGIQNLWLDLMGKDVADPDSVVLDGDETRAFITCSGGNSVNVVPVRGDGDTVTIEHVGAQPRGLALTPDRKELWVANLLGNDVAVIDARTLKITRRVSLGPATRRDPALLGRYLFGTAEIVSGKQFSCNSCHPDGGTDGISWKFVHVHDALGKEIDRNVKSLRGGIADMAPYRWSGHELTLAKIIAAEIPGLLQGPPPSAVEVQAIARYVGSLPLAPNPYRAPDGALTEAAARGEALFEGKAGCAACHAGPKAGGGGKRAWIGTTPEGIDLAVPHLDGVYDTDPYLHDGSAYTLEEVFSSRNPGNLHGKAHELSSAEMKELLEYVREL
ncbi:MAG TPA: beta-propeller fold lactonase family protein [Chthonomonadaceae bacterium]|nr:beta-propeller fold lactonase family protein [Chthonomonadaceae bacterium]